MAAITMHLSLLFPLAQRYKFPGKGACAQA